VAGCRSSEPLRARADAGGSPAGASGGAALAPAEDDLPELEVTTFGDMTAGERGGTAVVLLHGWGARGDDLVSLGQRLARPRTRFFLPAGPLHRGSGRAWWHLEERPAYAHEAKTPAGYQPSLAVARARRAVQALLSRVRQSHAPDRLVLGGFSQGAMLALDVALAGPPRVDRVAALSGLLLADSVASLLRAREPHPAVLVTHGRSDRVLPFAGSEAAARLLAERGFPVTFHPFAGGHQIPENVVQALARLVYE
jgi:phospholipase/carboxylesterase